MHESRHCWHSKEVSEIKFPPAPLTIEGTYMLHQMLRVKWGSPVAREGLDALAEMQSSAAFTMLGHKGDVLLLHLRNSLDELNAAESALGQAGLYQWLEPVNSYVSVVELGLYESTLKFYAEMKERNIAPESEAWNAEAAQNLERQRKAMAVRLFPGIPDTKYVCFYPMDRKRGETKNWYSLAIEDRARMMHEHGMNGRRYAGRVKQIISGSIGFDDWEWGVDLFADEALDFKRLIYEMRFDEVSADYAVFGPFYIAVRRTPEELETQFQPLR